MFSREARLISKRGIQSCGTAAGSS